MARAGEAIEHPVTGERLTFVRTAADTGGELLELDFALAPSGYVAAAHIHPNQEERFEVRSGRTRFAIGGRESVARAGDVITVPAGTPHVWWNDGDEEARVVIRFRPALDTETFFETFFGLARDGKVGDDGLPGLLQMAVITQHFREEIWPARQRQIPLTLLPLPLQRGLVALAAALGRARGYRARYPEYSASA